MDDDLEASVRGIIARLRAAMADVANGDVAAIKSLYSHSPDATSFYGWGGFEKGWEAVSKRWDWAGAQFRGGTVRYENVSTVMTPGMFYVTDIETFEGQRVASVEGLTAWSNRGSPTSFAVKAANGGCFIAMATGWKRNTSHPPNSPGEWLFRAVRGCGAPVHRSISFIRRVDESIRDGS